MISSYVKIDNSLFKMQTVTEFDITEEQEQEIIQKRIEQGWKHYKTIKYQYGKLIQSNMLFMLEIS